MKRGICVLGVFVADAAYSAERLPKVGETIAGSGFSIGPGGKGSNQAVAVAAARAGAEVSFVSKIGRDAFGEMGLRVFSAEGISAEVISTDELPTGSAFIFVNETTGDNAIIIYPGAAGTLTASDVEAARGVIERAAVFVTQLEQPVDAALCGLEIARKSGARTIFNPAPAKNFPREMYSLADYLVPNETEASSIVGFPLQTIEGAGVPGTFCWTGALARRSSLLALGGCCAIQPGNRSTCRVSRSTRWSIRRAQGRLRRRFRGRAGGGSACRSGIEFRMRDCRSGDHTTWRSNGDAA